MSEREKPRGGWRIDARAREPAGARRRAAAWWDGLARPQKWVFGVLLFGASHCCRCYTAAVSGHPRHQLRRHDGAVRHGRDHRDRPQCRGGPGRPARPRLRRLLCRRRVHGRAAHQPRQPVEQGRPDGFFSTPWAWLSCVPLAMAITALAGLILGFPTLRLRGDYLAIVTLGFGEIIRLMADNLADTTGGPRGLNEIAFPRVGESEKLPGRSVLQRELDGPRELRHLVVLARSDPDRRHPDARRQPGTQPGRPRLDRHPRGRGRRRSHGRQHLPIQAVGVRDRRGDRRAVRGAVRGPGAVRRTDRRSTSSTRCCSCARWCSADRATSSA